MEYNFSLLVGADIRMGEAPPLPPPSCYPPVISNVVATKLENGFVKLTWNFSRNGSSSYCNGSRQFYVAHVSYRTYDEAVRDNLDQRNFDYQPAGRRKKEYIFTALATSIFHRFVVTSLKGRGSQGFSRLVMTRLQHFVESGECVVYVLCVWAGEW